jgi:flagellar basal body P-ring formation protein FlgA
MPARQCRFRPPLIALLCAFAGPWTCQGALAEQASVSARAITELVEHSLHAQVSASPMARDARRVEVSAGALDSRLALGACAEPISVTADLSREQARVNARVSCEAPSPWSIYVPAEIRIYRPALVATRELQRGEAIGDADVALEERDVLAAGSAPLTRPDEVRGLAARRPIAANTVLSASLVEMPVQVRRGDRISVSAQSGGISVQVSGEALGTGRRGERVRVRNLQSGRVIDAVVTGSGTAEAI